MGSRWFICIGDQFDLIAFPWLVLMVSGDPVAVGIVLAVGNIPTIFSSLSGGSLADRYSPRVIMLTSNGIRIALVASLAVLVLTELADLWLIYVFALLKGIADSFYYPPNWRCYRALYQSNYFDSPMRQYVRQPSWAVS